MSALFFRPHSYSTGPLLLPSSSSLFLSYGRYLTLVLAAPLIILPHDETDTMKVTRRGKVAAVLVLILMLMLAVPLWQLGDHAAAGYYSRHAHDRPEDGVAINSTLPHQKDTHRATKAQSSLNPHCRGFPNTDGILLVMKTGATEIYAKMPTQLLTAMSCLPDFLLYSDIVYSFPNANSLLQWAVPSNTW